MIKSNLILFLLILTFTESFSQILPSYQGIYFKKKIIESNLILHLDASNSSSFDSNDLTVWNDLSSSNNDFTLKNGGVTFSSDNGGSLVFDGYDYFCINPISNLNTSNLTISLFITLSLLNIYGQDMLSIEKQDFLYKEDNNKIGLPKPKEKRIIFFGNSITQGWSSFTDYFKKNNYVNRGISGQTTPQMLLRYNDDVVNLKPYDPS